MSKDTIEDVLEKLEPMRLAMLDEGELDARFSGEPGELEIIEEE